MCGRPRQSAAHAQKMLRAPRIRLAQTRLRMKREFAYACGIFVFVCVCARARVLVLVCVASVCGGWAHRGKLLLLADSHLLGPLRRHWIDMVWSDWGLFKVCVCVYVCGARVRLRPCVWLGRSLPQCLHLWCLPSLSRFVYPCLPACICGKD